MGTINPSKEDVPQKYRVVVGAFLSLVALGLVAASFGVFFKPLSNEFGWTRGDTSGAYSTTMLVSGVLSIILGRLVDKFSHRLIILLCGAAMGCACLLLSRMNTLWELYLYFGVLVGFGMATMIPTTSLVTRTYKEHRGLLTGLTIMGASLGSIIAAPFITMLIENFNWRTAYLFLGMVILVVVAISAVFLRDPAKETPSTVSRNSSILKKILGQRSNILPKAVYSRPFWILGIILFCVGFAQSVIMVHLIPYATDEGVSALISASIISVFQGACAVGNFSVGRFNDIIGGKPSMVICLISLTLSYVILLIANTVWFFYIAAILAGIGFGGAVTLRSTIVAELFGLHSHGEITGRIMFISTIGSAVGPVIAGYIFDISDQYLWALITTISVCIIGLMMAGFLRSRFAMLS